MSVGVLYEVLFAGFVISCLLSFVYMLQKRSLLSALFWFLVPMRWLLSWGSDTPYDDNPDWLDRIQLGFAVAIGLLWLVGKAKLFP